MMKWISVKDELPNTKGFYLVFVDNKVVSSRKLNIEIQECYETVDISLMKPILKFHDTVRYWMPLPESPVEKENIIK